MMLPETLYQKLPNTLYEAKKFGKEQVITNYLAILSWFKLHFDSPQTFWSLPKKPKIEKEEEMQKLNAEKKSAA